MVKKKDQGGPDGPVYWSHYSLGLMMAFVDRKSQWYQSLDEIPLSARRFRKLLGGLDGDVLPTGRGLLLDHGAGHGGRGLYACLLHFAAYPSCSYLSLCQREIQLRRLLRCFVAL